MTGRTGTDGNEETSFDQGYNDGTRGINKSLTVGKAGNKDDELSFDSEDADPLLNNSCAAPSTTKALSSAKK